MTRIRWAEMSLEERRIKVAELCGWRCSVLGNWWHQMVPPDGDGTKVETCPDYLNDLNAMHWAEMNMSEEQPECYEENLIRVMSTPEGCHPGRVLWFATAAERAEAFALTMEPEDDYR